MSCSLGAMLSLAGGPPRPGPATMSDEKVRARTRAFSKPHAEEVAHQADAVIAVRQRDMGVARAPDAAGRDDGEPGGMHRLEDILLRDLQPCPGRYQFRRP